MVNKVILDYLRKYHRRYRIEDLKRKILSAGYSKREVEEALAVLHLKPVKPVVKPTKPIKQVVRLVKPVVKPIRAVKPVVEPIRMAIKSVKQPEKGEPAKSIKPVEHIIEPVTPVVNGSKWLKIGGVGGILAFIFLILAFIFEIFFAEGAILPAPITFIFSLLTFLFLILYFYGFVVLGKKYGKKLVKTVSWVFIAFIVLSIVLEIILIVFSRTITEYVLGFFVIESFENFNINAFISVLISTFFTIFLILILLLLVFIILNVLFGIGLMKLRVKFSKIAGILHILGGCLLIVGVGIMLLFVAFIIEIVLLFKESKV